MGVENALAATLLEACDLVDFVDMETGRTLMLRKDLPRGDISTNDVRKLIRGEMTPQEMADHRRFVHARAKALTDAIFAKRGSP
jgi:hypothetical protein